MTIILIPIIVIMPIIIPITIRTMVVTAIFKCLVRPLSSAAVDSKEKNRNLTAFLEGYGLGEVGHLLDASIFG